MAQEMIPSLKSVTVLCNVTQVQPALKELKTATTNLGMELYIYDVRAFPELHKTFNSLPSRIELIWMVQDSISGDKFGRRFLEENCIRRRIPLHAYSKDVLREGALFHMAVESSLPVYYLNKAAAALIQYTPPVQMQSKITAVE